jgi:hypothetical protein
MIAKLRSIGRMGMHLAMPLLALAALQACGSATSAAGNSFQEAYDKSFRASFETSFLESCRAGATGKGAPAALADKACACGAEQLLAKYNTSELAKLSREQIVPVMEVCARKTAGAQ